MSPGDGIPGAVLRGRDVVVEAASALTARPGRTALTALGTVLGVATLVATLGLARTAGNQIVARFDALAATQVVVTPVADEAGPSGTIPWDAEERIARLNGVRAVGTLTPVDTGAELVTSVPVRDPLGLSEFAVPVVAASPGLLGAVRGTISAGRWLDAIHDRRADAVAILGRAAADRLNIRRIDNQPAVFVGDTPFVVVGIIGDVARQPDLLGAIVIPNGTARAFYDLRAPAEVHVDTDTGAARLIAEQAPLALDPTAPSRLASETAPDPAEIRSQVESDVNALFVVLGGVSFLVGALGIANVTLISVLERVREIGLRRALGARRRHIASQFLLESTCLGALGGLVGASAGVIAVVAVSAARDWTPFLDPWLPPAAWAAGTLVGFVAGIYPAMRAAATEPITALRAA